MPASPSDSSTSQPRDLWDDLLPSRPYLKPPGATEMLRLIAYDIAQPRRLQRIADVCEDYGVRIQYSLFECWLEDEAFAALWSRLQTEFDPDEDRLVAYTLDRAAVGRRQTAGATMTVTREVNCYVV